MAGRCSDSELVCFELTLKHFILSYTEPVLSIVGASALFYSNYGNGKQRGKNVRCMCVGREKTELFGSNKWGSYVCLNIAVFEANNCLVA